MAFPTAYTALTHYRDNIIAHKSQFLFHSDACS